MGTIAARDCLRVLDLTSQVAAALSMASVQGVVLRQRQTEVKVMPAVEAFMASVGEQFAFLDEDRRLDGELRHLTDLIRRNELPVCK